MNIILYQSWLLLLFTVFHMPEISASKKKTIKIIVPHKIKFVHHHHTHVLVVKEKKPHHHHPEPQPKVHHLHYHQNKKKGNIKHHYYIPYIPHSHGAEDEEGTDESVLEYSVTVPSIRNGMRHHKQKPPAFYYDGSEYELLSGKTPKYAQHEMLNDFYERNSDELLGTDTKNEFYETDPYFQVSPVRMKDNAYKKEVDIIPESNGKHFEYSKESMHFRPITPVYDNFNAAQLFYPTKSSIYGQKPNKKRTLI